ncbi:putative extracellular SCP domain protein Pry1 [Aspergillus affinis]|uniref:putative extracellular SCP domain protein Pry1 n=1 Tax=Aspergillus affinis TaxID=1070780 RepID=UPI0022FF0EE7|nr:PR-1-like protein [Aspergillus affinis]KAI9038340.1 PR-1-like protein [Aspergillus affinis]
MTMNLPSMTSPSLKSPIPLILLVLYLLFTLAPAEQIVQTTVVIVTVGATATPTVPQPPSYTSADVFKDDVLSASNAYRRVHNATDLLWNETLTDYAHAWAQKCKWKHSVSWLSLIHPSNQSSSPSCHLAASRTDKTMSNVVCTQHGPYGENLAFGYPNASAAIAAWGDEVRHYDFQKPTGFTEETGHFTQLVWKATKQVGCAAVDCGYTGDDDNAKDASGRYRYAQGWYVVCEYLPPGNVMDGTEAMGGGNGLFIVNVQPSGTYSGPSTTTSTDDPATSTAATSGAGRAWVLEGHSWTGRLAIVGMILIWFPSV